MPDVGGPGEAMDGGPPGGGAPGVRTVQGTAYAQTRAGADVIDLRIGQPSPEMLGWVHEATSLAACRGVAGSDRLVLQYADVAGFLAFRASLAAWLSLGRDGQGVDAEELVATAGASHALDLCARNLARPGGVVAVGEPTYFLARDVFERAGLACTGVPSDAEGMDVDALERLVARGGPKVEMVYVVPVHANPTGACLSRARAEKLVGLAREHGFVVVADEVYLQLDFPSEDPPPSGGRRRRGPSGGKPWGSLRGLDPGGESVVSLGSLSKVFAPGLRVGWIQAGPETRARLRQDACLSSGGGVNPLGCATAWALLQSGEVEEARERNRRALGERKTALVDALEEHLCPLGARFDVPRGGYFVWVSIPGVDAEVLLPRAREQHGVGFLPGARCRAATHGGGDAGDSFADSVRLSFAFYSAAELQLGVERLARAVHEHLEINRDNRLNEK